MDDIGAVGGVPLDLPAALAELAAVRAALGVAKGVTTSYAVADLMARIERMVQGRFETGAPAVPGVVADDAATRESIARYLEHCSRTEIGAISLDGLFDTKQMMGVCASWVRNRLDVTWAAEMAANTPVEAPTQPEGVAQDEDCRVRPCACACHTDVEEPGPHLLTCAWAKDSYVPGGPQGAVR